MRIRRLLVIGSLVAGTLVTQLAGASHASASCTAFMESPVKIKDILCVDDGLDAIFEVYQHGIG